MNIIKHRYLFFLISLLVIIPGAVALILWVSLWPSISPAVRSWMSP